MSTPLEIDKVSTQTALPLAASTPRSRQGNTPASSNTPTLPPLTPTPPPATADKGSAARTSSTASSSPDRIGATPGVCLLPLHTRAPSRPTPSAAAGIHSTYPPASSAALPYSISDHGGLAARVMATVPAPAAAAELMELAVVPFSGTPRSAPQRPTDPLATMGSSLGRSLHDTEGPRLRNEEGTPYYGELAPTTVSTERVCPHCLRPYSDDVYGDDDFALYGAPRTFFQSTPIRPAKQLPPPPSLSSSNDSSPTQPGLHPRIGGGGGTSPGALGGLSRNASGEGGEEAGVVRGNEMVRSPPQVRTTGGSGSGVLHRGGDYSGPAFPPPAIAFTTHYFRALPPPAVIAAAVAAGTSPLAIEDYPSSELPSEADSSMVGGGGAAREETTMSYNGALVPATATTTTTTSPHFSYVSPTTRLERRARLQLLRAEEDCNKPSGGGRDTAFPKSRLMLDEEQDQDDEGGSSSPTSPVYSPNAPGPEPNNGYYRHYFKELRQLGRGTYGGVYLCRHMMCGVNLGNFALKKIPVGDKAGYLQSVLREVRILEEVRRHPNVVEYKHSWVEDAQLADFGPPVRCLFILMEYASAGSLDTYLEKYGTNLSTLAVWYFFLSAVAGTAHLHQKHILHRDLKPQNLLLAAAKGRPPRVLVSDFGTAALLDDISYERSGGTGTLEYMAPELFEMTASPRGANEHYVNHHTMASDVWSLGMVLHYLAFDATLPEHRDDGSLILDSPRRASYGRPPEMLRLMEAMLELDPTKRPRCADIMGNTYVQSILRVFNRDDLTQWDLLAQEQQQQQPRAGPGARSPSSHRASLQKASVHAGSGVSTGSGGDASAALGPRRRNLITVTSTSSSGLSRRRPNHPVADGSSSGDAPESDNLFSSRVELLSTSALVDLPGVRPPSGNNVLGAEGLSQQLHLHRGRRASGRPRPGSFPDTVSSPGSTPPPPTRTVDAGVQTDPVRIVDL